MRPDLPKFALALTLSLLSPGCADDGAAVADRGTDVAADGSVSADVAADLAPVDAAPKVALTLAQPSSPDLPIGSHQLLKLAVAPAGAAVSAKLAARPCLLKLKGQGQGPTGELALSLAPGNSGAELVVFAPPDAPPGATCAPAVVGSGPALAPVSLTVKPPKYVVKNVGDHAITLVEGMAVTTVGKLTTTSKPVQSLTFAEGGFGGKWVAVTGDDGDQLVTPSSVSFFQFSATDSGDLTPWLDLAGQTTNPTAVEDMVWSPVGPCPTGPDALYVAGPGADAPAGASDDAGGVYCVGTGKQVSTILDDSARTLDVDRGGAFHPPHGNGTIYVSRWGGHYVVPGGVGFSDPALPSLANLFRFATGGPHKGDLYVLAVSGANGLHALTRVTPAPHTAVPLAELQKSSAWVALSHGGAFGELVLVSDESPSYTLYNLTALFDEGGKVRQLVLVRWLQCGRRMAFDASGQHLVVVTASKNSSCTGPSTVHRFSFPLP